MTLADCTGLIAASFGTVAYNGFYCQPKSVLFFCSTNALCGALGSYLPFQRWFNERKYKVCLPRFMKCAGGGGADQVLFRIGESHSSSFSISQ